MSKRYGQKGGRVVRHTLADGSVKTYRYSAYRPNKRRKPNLRTVGALIDAWERSPEWAALAPRTKEFYQLAARRISMFEAVQVTDITRKLIIDNRNEVFATKGSGAANSFLSGVSAMFYWGLQNGWLDYSPVTKIKPLRKGHYPTWTQQEADLALQHLPEYLRRAVILALYTGQRRADLVSMSWADYDGAKIRITQGKTRKRLVIPCHPVLKAELDKWKAETKHPLILSNFDGNPWKHATGLSENLSRRLARIPGFPEGRNIHGLRKLAGQNLAEAGCSVHEIAAILGHQTLAMVELYTRAADQERLAEAAIIRLANRKTK